MKILYGITKSNFGGAQRYVFDLSSAAKARGHEVVVICGGTGILTEKLSSSGIRVITLPQLERDVSLLKEWVAFKFILEILRKEKPDVFHTNSSKMGGLGNLAARLARVKRIVFTSHGWAFNESWRPWWQKILIRFLVWFTISLSHITICVSEKSRENASWPLIQSKLAVVRNGLEPFPLLPRTEAREKLNISKNELVVGTLAELHKVKGLDNLLRAWQKFEGRRKAILIILGEGEEKENLIKLAHKLKIGGSVSFRGFQPNAKEFLSAFDIFVLPSRSENLPYALLEAGHAGLPIIASRVGGIPEVIKSGENGILTAPESQSELLSGLLLLSESEPLRKRLGEAIQKTIANHFSYIKMIGETFSKYEF